MLWREVGTHDFIQYSVIVLAEASGKVRAASTASQRHGLVVTPSVGKCGTEGSRRLAPAALCFSTLGCSRVLAALAEFQGDCRHRGGNSVYIGDPLTVEFEPSSLL